MAHKRKRRSRLARRYGHTYAGIKARHGHAFAEDVRKAGAKLHRLAQEHPAATAALTGASIGTVAGGLGTGAAALLGGTAALIAEETSRKRGKGGA
jgi:hypothetical protein